MQSGRHHSPRFIPAPEMNRWRWLGRCEAGEIVDRNLDLPDVSKARCLQRASGARDFLLAAAKIRRSCRLERRLSEVVRVALHSGSRVLNKKRASRQRGSGCQNGSFLSPGSRGRRSLFVWRRVSTSAKRRFIATTAMSHQRREKPT